MYNFLKKSLEIFFLLLENLLLLYKKKLYRRNIKKNLLCVNINMINLSVDEIKLVAKNTDIKDYKNKSKEDLIKILSESKSKRKINKKNLEEIIKIFKELRHKFSKKETDK